MIYTIELREYLPNNWEVKVWLEQGINFTEATASTEGEARELALPFVISATKERKQFTFGVNRFVHNKIT